MSELTFYLNYVDMVHSFYLRFFYFKLFLNIWVRDFIETRAHISLDEVTHAFSLCPVPSEPKLLCGLKSQVREFDLNLPGQTIFYVFYLDNVWNLFCEEKNLQVLSGEPELISKPSG